LIFSLDFYSTLWYSYLYKKIKIMISYYKQQEQIGERQRAEMKANAGKPVKFDFRSAEQCRIDSAKEKIKKQIKTS